MNRLFSHLIYFGVFVSSLTAGAQQKEAEGQQKHILVIVAGDQLAKNDLRVSYVEGSITNQIFSFSRDRRLIGDLSKKEILVRKETIEIIVESGGLKYSFDIETRDGMMCGLFKNADSGIVISTNMDSASFADTIDDRKVVTILLTGDVWEKRVGLSIDSKLIFDDLLRGSLTPFTKRASFSINEPIFNAVLNIEGIKYSLDFDVSEGCAYPQS